MSEETTPPRQTYYDNLQTWYENQKNSAKFQIAIIETLNKTNQIVVIDENFWNTIKNFDHNTISSVKTLYKSVLTPLDLIKKQLDLSIVPVEVASTEAATATTSLGTDGFVKLTISQKSVQRKSPKRRK